MPLNNVLSLANLERGGVLNSEGVDADDRLREADHRISNNLALIAGFTRLQAANAVKQSTEFSAAEVRLLLMDTAARIDAVGQLHKVLSVDCRAASIDLGEYLENMCEAMHPLVSLTGPMELHCAPGRGCMVAAEETVPIALIVSEMVTNSIKYAHPAGVPGRIDVGCYRDGSGMVIEVADNGVGLPENFDPHRSGGLGFTLVRTLAKKLEATPIFDSDTLGLRFLLILPGRDQRQ